jgi:gluconolactonase
MAVALLLCRQVSAQITPADYAGLTSADYLGDVEELAVLTEQPIFTEGPAVAADGTVFFTNIPAEQILTWSPRTRQLSVAVSDSHKTNGLCFDSSGRLLCCEGATGRVTRRDLKAGTVETLADKWNGLPLAAPNDLCIDHAGRIWFSSRPGAVDPSQGNVNAVYCIRADGTLTQPLAAPAVEMPNGVDVSPDGKLLIVIESHPDADRARSLKTWQIADDGSLSAPRTLFNFYPGRGGDGMAVDEQGNVYVAAGLHATRRTSETLDTRPGIHVISPTGRLLAFRQTPEDTITNCCFGGTDRRTLYITCGSRLLQIRTRIPGATLPRQ